MKKYVIKRDKTLEEYSESKITKVVVAAGLNQEEAQFLTNSLNKWANSETSTKLSSLQIRDKVLQELKKLNEDAANMFGWYQKTKE